MAIRFDPRPVTRRFWRDVGDEEPFPRDLTRAVIETYPAGVILLPRLSVSLINDWLAGRGKTGCLRQRNRNLRGCLLARKGCGLIFLDETAPDDERRMALAHEVAHFVHHYLVRRERALRKLGNGILPVLNGQRKATISEQLSGALLEVPLDPFEDVLDRDAAGRPSEGVERLESEADMIAFELLAPSEVVFASSSTGGAARVEHLRKQFGLPPWGAELWASHLDNRGACEDATIVSLERALKNR